MKEKGKGRMKIIGGMEKEGMTYGRKKEGGR